MEVISRIHFCRSCHDAGRPRANDVYVVKGTTSKQLYVRKAKRRAGVTRGFTPHFIRFKKQISDKVVYESTCGIVGCGLALQKEENGSYDVVPKVTRKWVIDFSDWQALVDLFKETDYEI